jgi:hypothetical protein
MTSQNTERCRQNTLQNLNKANAAYLQSADTNRLCTFRTKEIEH